jgi:glycosyltransferase involved in cell wall biosynthesis
MPNAVLEAMAAGLPVVATSVGGVPDVVTHGRTGLLVPSGDPAALAQQMCALMADAGLGTRLGLAARAYVQQHFSFDRMVSAIENLYLRTLANRGVTSGNKAA